MAKKLNFSEEQIIQAASESISYAELMEKLRYVDRNSGGAFKTLKKYIKIYGIDISHFTRKRNEIIEKICPKCGKKFNTSGVRQTIFCSHSCANGSRYRKYDPDGLRGYRYIFSEGIDKECIICGEDVIVEVHHYDEDHTNHDRKNLVPLCPTHHKYIHATVSGYNLIIKECVDDYVKKML